MVAELEEPIYLAQIKVSSSIVLPTLSNEVPSVASIEGELKTKFLKARYLLFHRAEIATGGSNAAGN
jgi:hypothetical protein